jgi:SAM-dependent methyltransferase
MLRVEDRPTVSPSRQGDTFITRERLVEGLKQNLAWLIASSQTIRWATEKIALREVFEALKLSNSRCAADLGCGGAHYIIDLLVPLSTRVLGVEIDEKNLRIAAGRLAAEPRKNCIALIRASTDNVPIPDRSVDLILCTQVLEHLPDIRKGVSEMHRILRQGGVAVMSIPIPPDPHPNPEHLHKDFTPEVLDCILESVGFKILQRRRCMYAISRAVAWLLDAVHLPLPLVPLCRLEQATAGVIRWPRPHVYICAACKN